jgi:hypothetical protein
MSPDRLAVSHLECAVADRAPGKALVWPQLQGAQDLADLAFQALIGNQQNLHAAPLSQLVVASEQHTVVRSGNADELIVIKGRIVQRIVAQDAKPLGQCAQHCISNK